MSEFLTLKELANAVEKSGKRFRAALERKARAAHFETLKKRVESGDRTLEFSHSYNQLFALVTLDRGLRAQSVDYHEAALKEYAIRAWRLAREIPPCGCGAIGQERRRCEGCGADELCESCFYDHRCDAG